MKNFFKKLMSSKSQSKYFSETVQRVGKNNAGFSLVELIVVIAIMAILAAVAVIGVSVYIPKAQQANDKQLVSDVEYALNLYYQSNANNMTGGYVVLSADGVTAGGCAAEALKLVYGENWAGNNDLKLTYDGWGEDALLNTILSSDVGNIAGSSFMQNASPEELLGTVTTLTQAATNALTETGKTAETVAGVLGITEEELAKNLEGLEEGTEAYNTAMSNLMVTYLAKEFSDLKDTAEDEQAPSFGAQLAMTYANMYAFALTNPGAKAEMEQINKNLADAEDQAGLIAALTFSEEFQREYDRYTSDETTFTTNFNAFVDVMDAANSVSGELTDFTNPNLYTSDKVTSLFGTYTDAVNAVSGLSADKIDEIKNNYKSGDIVILISEEGEITTFPMTMSE